MLKINIKSPKLVLENKSGKNAVHEVGEEYLNKEEIITENGINKKNKKDHKTPKKVLSKELFFPPRENKNLEYFQIKLRAKSPRVQKNDNLILKNQNFINIKKKNVDLDVLGNQKIIQVHQFFPNENINFQSKNINNLIENQKITKDKKSKPLTSEQQIKKAKLNNKLKAKKEDKSKKSNQVKIEIEKYIQKFDNLITKHEIKTKIEEKNERLKLIEEVKNLPKYSKKNLSIKDLSKYYFPEEKNVSETINDADIIIRKVS